MNHCNRIIIRGRQMNAILYRNSFSKYVPQHKSQRSDVSVQNVQPFERKFFKKKFWNHFIRHICFLMVRERFPKQQIVLQLVPIIYSE